MKTYLTYGFAMALGGLVLTVLLFFLGFHSDPAKLATGQMIGMVGGLTISVVCIVFGTKARRAEIPAAEPFGYAQALGTGVMITLFSSIFGVLGHWLYISVINPGMIDVTVQAQIAKWEAMGMSGDQIEKAENVMRKMMSPAVQAGFAFIFGMIFGTVISLITSAFLKRPASDQPPLTA